MPESKKFLPLYPGFLRNIILELNNNILDLCCPLASHFVVVDE
jgi:hypothetical protein